MKIVCDACQAKYSISDDKVQGKVFKIRCKKCSNIIVVRGGTQAAEPAPAPAEKDTRVYDYGAEGGGGGGGGEDEAVWHLVINQDQVGPMTAAEVQQRFAAGEVDAETYAWREGFADWLPLSQVDAFASLAASGAASVPSGGGGAAAVSAMFGSGDDSGTSRSDPGDLFAAASSTASSRHAAPDDDGGDLFGSSKPAAAPAAAAEQKLRGERNENSVLFSLNNLAQLASNSPAPAAAASSSGPSSAPGHATGAAGGEGSGLIDIRSMASAYLGGGGAAKPAAAASAGVGSIDDLPVFGGAGFSEPSVLVPTSRPQSNNKILYIMIGAVGLLAVAAVIMVVMLLKGNKTPPATQVAAVDKPTSGDSDKPSDKPTDKPADKPTDPTATPGGGSSAATPAGGGSSAATPPPTGDSGGSTPAGGNHNASAAPKNPPPAGGHNAGAAPPAGGHTGGSPPPAGGHTGGAPAGGHTGGAPPPPSGGTPPPSGGGDSCDEVSCVLNNYDGACCAKFKKAKAGGAAPSGGAKPSGGGGDLPAQLDREMISSGIGGVKGKATACGDKSSAKGVVKVHVKVDGSGKVSSVSVSQTPDPALGACVAAAVQHASFAKTQNGGSFSYPFPF